LFFKGFSFFTVVMLILILISCGGDSPTGPEVIANQLEYFPLRFGYNAEYSFSYDYSYYNEISISHKIDGVFKIAVVQALQKQNSAFFRIASKFLIEKEEYIKRYPGGILKAYTNVDFTREFEFDLLFEKDTLWYVNDAPSFLRMNEGSRFLMMGPQIAGQGTLNLDLFNYPPNLSFRSDLDYKTRSEEDELIYSFRGAVYNGGTFPNVITSIISFVENKGIVELDYTLKEFVSVGGHKGSVTSANFKLIE